MFRKGAESGAVGGFREGARQPLATGPLTPVALYLEASWEVTRRVVRTVCRRRLEGVQVWVDNLPAPARCLGVVVPGEWARWVRLHS